MYLQWLKSLNRLHPRAWDFVQLSRMDRPIGIYLLLWPTLSAVWIAGNGSPTLANVLIFGLGVVLMRAAGCCINDFADRKVDGHVKRTADRPLASGRVRPREALALFAILVGVSFLLVLCTNSRTVWLSFGAVALAFCYPFMKRYTYYPQVVLGAAYSWGIPMAFTAAGGELPASAWLLYIANLLWTVGYDTYYAMVDRDDDLKIGVKSTAILFGEADRTIILTLQLLSLGCLLLAGSRFELGGWFHLGLLGAAACFAWEYWSTRPAAPGGTSHPARSGCRPATGSRFELGGWFHLGLLGAAACFAWEYWSTRRLDRESCFKAFLHNHWAGMLVFIGVLLDYALR